MSSLLNKQNVKKVGIRAAGTLSIPLAFVVVLLIVCASNGKTLIGNEIEFNTFMINVAVIMCTTIALSINLGSGRFDFSLGSMATLSSIIAAKISYSAGGGNTNAFFMIFLCLVVGAVLGLISGGLYVLLKIPPIITSLGVTLIYEGMSYVITEGTYLTKEPFSDSMVTAGSNWWITLLIVLAVLAIIYVVFDHTKFGREYRSLKEGQNISVNTGIKEIPNALICYSICGALMGIVGFLRAANTHMIGGSQLNFGSISLMFTAFLPMFIGGFIGRFSNDKLGYFLAAICMALINSMFLQFTNELTQASTSIINAVLLVAFLIFLNNEQTFKDLVTGKLFKKWWASFKDRKAKMAENKQ